MRRSEFTRAVQAEFGARGDALVVDLALSGMSYRTAAQALDDGADVREVWLPLCGGTDVPMSRRHGVGRLERRR